MSEANNIEALENKIREVYDPWSDNPAKIAEHLVSVGYALSTPPADDVREAVRRGYNAAPGLAVNLVVDSIMEHLAAFEVRPRGMVTEAEVERALDALAKEYVILTADQMRAALEAARNA